MPEQTTKQMLEQNGEQNTKPELSRSRSRPTTTPNSPPDRLADLRNAREEPSQPTSPEDDRWLVGYRLNRMNSTAMLGGFNPALTSVLRTKKWATLVRDEGWVIPIRYLAHTERLLAGADVDLFDIEGAPTPGQRARERNDDHAQTQRVLNEIRAARDAAHADENATAEARAEMRKAFDDAIAAAQARRTPINSEPISEPVDGVA